MTVWSDQRAAAKSGRPRGFHGESADHKLRTLLSFLVPTLCDAFATTLLNIGLFYTCAEAVPACAQAYSQGGCTYTSLAGLLTTLHASCVASETACALQPHGPQKLPPHLGSVHWLKQQMQSISLWRQPVSPDTRTSRRMHAAAAAELSGARARIAHAERAPSYEPRRRYASVFQMLRGTLVVFAGALTIILLKRRLHIHHYFGITLITAGAALVGASRCALRSNTWGPKT